MFSVSRPSPSSNNTLESCWQRTRDRAVYSWPCANTGVHRSRMVLSRVRPTHPLNVQAYASLKGNCILWTVQLECAGENSNRIRGMQCVTPNASEQLLMTWTSTNRRWSRWTTTRVFLTRPCLTDMLRISVHIQPFLRRRMWRGTPLWVRTAR